MANIDPTIILISTSISLIGLQICLPKDDVEKLDEVTWTKSPLLKIIYGIIQLVGVVFVLGGFGYLTFFEHWWYLLVYFGAFAIARLMATISNALIESFFARRIIGTIIILCGILFLVITL
ncbi:MAG: hypothetical protein IJM66_10650 [Muribaculaceae bacterium]|nr:hypothetical protein [Muribaculaceae bacterium]